MICDIMIIYKRAPAPQERLKPALLGARVFLFQSSMTGGWTSAADRVKRQFSRSGASCLLCRGQYGFLSGMVWYLEKRSRHCSRCVGISR